MGKYWDTIKEIFLKFWCDNIKKNYKKISYALGVLITTVVGYVIILVTSTTSPEIMGIAIAIDGFMTYLAFTVFGKTQNGNGYGKPETKLLLKVMEEDDEFRLLALKKAEEYVKKSKALNGFNHD